MTERDGDSQARRVRDPADVQIAIIVDLDESGLVVRVSGELDLATRPVLEQELRPYLGKAEAVVYDLSECDFIDATGLRALQGALGAKGIAEMTIREPSSAVRRLLRLVGLESMIESEES